MKKPVRKRKGYADGGRVTAYDFDPVKATRKSPGVEAYSGPDTQPPVRSRDQLDEDARRAKGDYSNSYLGRWGKREADISSNASGSVSTIQKGMAEARQSLGDRDTAPAFSKGGKVKKVVPIKRKRR